MSLFDQSVLVHCRSIDSKPLDDSSILFHDPKSDRSSGLSSFAVRSYHGSPDSRARHEFSHLKFEIWNLKFCFQDGCGLSDPNCQMHSHEFFLIPFKSQREFESIRFNSHAFWRCIILRQPKRIHANAWTTDVRVVRKPMSLAAYQPLSLSPLVLSFSQREIQGNQR